MASAVSSIYEYPISAASAAYAPTNTAEVTAMIDSAVSGKLDASASSAFITSTAGCQPAGDYVSSSELADYQTTAGMSGYATTGDLSGKLDNTSVFTGDFEGTSYTTAIRVSGQTCPILATRAMFADTASSWSEASSKLDVSASSSFMPASASGDYIPTASASDFQTTAAMSSYATTADLSGKLDASASSAFITSTAGLATTAELAEKLDASASSSFQPSGDYVSSSELSDYQTTAGMSAYATTGDLSGKLDASAEVVTSTSTAEYGIYSLITAINGKNVSAWVAATAAGAEYAQKDLNDRALTSLAASSSLADYQPTSSMSGYATTGDLSGYLPTSSIGVDSASAVTSIAGSSLAGGGGVVTATGTATAGDTAEPTTYVTSIDGMALSAANDTVLTATHLVTSYDPDLSASSTSTSTGTATGFGVVDQNTAVAFDSGSYVSSVKLNDGTALPIMANQLGAGTWQSGGKGNASYPYFWLQFSPSYNSFPGSVCTGYLNPLQYATGAGIMMSAGCFRGLLKANELFLTRENNTGISTATNSTNGYYIRAEAHNSRGSHIGLTAACVTGTAYTGDSSECWTSTGDISQSGVKFGYTSNRASSATARNNYYASLTTAGISLSANWPTASAKTGMRLLLSSLTFTSNDSSESGTGTASTVYANTGITFEDSASTATMEKSSIDYWNAKLDSSSIETDSASAITGIAGSAIAGGGGTTYSAGQYIQISGDEISVTGIDPAEYAQSSSLADYQTTAGMSAYATTGDLSNKLDTSASSAFITSTADCMPLSASANYATTGDLSAKLDASAETITSIENLGTSIYQLNGTNLWAEHAIRDNNNRALTSLAAASSLSAYQPTSSMGDYQTTAAMSGYATTGDLSAKLDASASSAFITSTAGLATTGDLDNYQTTAGMSAYATTGDLSAKLDISSIELDSASAITGIAGSAIAGGGGGSADWSATAGEPGYIENKPVPKTLVAGAGITITENASSLSVASTNALYSAGNGLTLNGTTFAVDTAVVATTSDLSGYATTQDLAGKQGTLTAGANITIDANNEISATDTTEIVSKTAPIKIGTYMGEDMYIKLYEFTGTVKTSETTVNFTIDETVSTGSDVTRIWIDPSNSFLQYGSATIKLPLTYRLGAGREGSVFVVSQANGTLSFRGVDTGATAITFFIAIRYTVSQGN